MSWPPSIETRKKGKKSLFSIFTMFSSNSEHRNPLCDRIHPSSDAWMFAFIPWGKAFKSYGEKEGGQLVTGKKEGKLVFFPEKRFKPVFSSDCI